MSSSSTSRIENEKERASESTKMKEGPRVGTRGPCCLLQFHAPVCVVEELLPRLVLPLRQLQVQQRRALRLFRLADQAHVRLLRRAAALADVAVHARAHDVLPRRHAALAARRDVVEAEFARRVLPPAVLALVVVAGKDVSAIELYRLLRHLVVVEEPDDARHLNLARRRAHPIVLLLAEVLAAKLAQLSPGDEVVGGVLALLEADDLSELLDQQAEGPSSRDDGDGHEHLVQDEHAGFEGRIQAWLHGHPYEDASWDPPNRAGAPILAPQDAGGRREVQLTVIF